MRPWIAGGCAAVLLALGVAVAGDTDGTEVDRAFSSWVHATFARWLLEIMAAPTSPALLTAVIAGAVIGSAVRRDWSATAVAALGPGLTVAINFLVLKPAFDRYFTGYLAYPSGHLALLCAVLTMAVLLVPLPPRYTVPVAATIAVVSAIALVGLDFHYLTDAVGGLCCGVAVTLTVGLLADRRGAVNREQHRA